MSHPGDDSLNMLIKEIQEVSSFDEIDLRIYTCSDNEREFDLLRYWTDEEKSSTLTELGFKQDEIYQFNNRNDKMKYTDLPSVVSKVLLLSLSCLEGVAIEASFNVSMALATSVNIK